MPAEEGAAVTLTLADLRYLLRLVQHDYWEATEIRRSLRIERKLSEMIGRALRKDCIMDANLSTTNPMETHTSVHPNGPMTEPWRLTIHRSKGGEGMGKTSKAAPKKPKGKIGKSVKKK